MDYGADAFVLAAGSTITSATTAETTRSPTITATGTSTTLEAGALETKAPLAVAGGLLGAGMAVIALL